MKVAIIGAGQIADAHIAEVRKIPGVQVVALCDLFESPLLALKEKYSIPNTFTNFNELLDNIRPDVVHITTPPQSHFPIAQDSISKGAHVYVEKPLTVTYEETVELCEIAEKAGKHLCVGTNYLFSRVQKEAQQLIRAEALGSLRHIDSVFSYNLQGIFGKQVLANPNHWIAQLPGQIFQNNVSHPLAAIVPYLSDDYSVSAWGSDWADNGVVSDEIRLRIVDSTNRLTANVVFSCGVQPAVFRTTYYGSKKTIVLNTSNHSIVVEEPPSLPGTLGSIFSIRALQKSLRRQFWHELFRFTFGKETYFTSMRELMECFYSALDGKGPLPIEPQHMLRTSKIIQLTTSQLAKEPSRRESTVM